MLAVLPGPEFAGVAAHEAGADRAAILTALEPGPRRFLVAGAMPFAPGTVLFAVAVARTTHFARIPADIITRWAPGTRGRAVPRAVGGDMLALLPWAVVIGAALLRTSCAQD